MDTAIVKIGWTKIREELKPWVDFEYMWNNIVTPQILIDLKYLYKKEGKAAKLIEVEIVKEKGWQYGKLKRILEYYSPLELSRELEL